MVNISLSDGEFDELCSCVYNYLDYMFERWQREDDLTAALHLKALYYDVKAVARILEDDNHVTCD